jgi:hypothetical protein
VTTLQIKNGASEANTDSKIIIAAKRGLWARNERCHFLATKPGLAGGPGTWVASRSADTLEAPGVP